MLAKIAALSIGRRLRLQEKTMPPISPEDHDALKDAVKKLECVGFMIKAASACGAPIDILVQQLPAKARGLVHEATRRALEACLELVMKTFNKDSEPATSSGSSDRLHKVACTASGLLGGFFGIEVVLIELPFSTAVMLRSIADIARSKGEDLSTLEARLECMKVFAFGARKNTDDDADTGYFAVRASIAKALSEMGDRALPPALARFLAVMAERFGPTVAEKVAAQTVPVIGAVGGGAINLVFIDHFQDVAHGHFTVRRLEREYGPERVREEYETIRKEMKC